MLKRWQRQWHWLFYVLLAGSTGFAAVELGSLERRAAIVALAAGLAIWYWRVVIRDGGVAAVPARRAEGWVVRPARGKRESASGGGWSRRSLIHGDERLWPPQRMAATHRAAGAISPLQPV